MFFKFLLFFFTNVQYFYAICCFKFIFSNVQYANTICFFHNTKFVNIRNRVTYCPQISLKKIYNRLITFYIWQSKLLNIFTRHSYLFMKKSYYISFSKLVGKHTYLCWFWMYHITRWFKADWVQNSDFEFGESKQY